MFNVRSCALRRFATGGLVLSVAGTSWAAVSADFITITASNANGTATFMVPTASVPFETPTVQTWDAGGAIDLFDGPNLVATIGGGSRVSVDNGGAGFSIAPSLFFQTTAGLTTRFQVSTATVSFPIQSLVGGSGAMSLTDGGAGDGASLTGNNTGGNSLVGRYTDFVLGPQDLFGAVPSIVIAGGSGDDGFPGTVIAAQATAISLDYDFFVSGNDAASTTGVIGAAPEPTSIMLLALGGLFAARRR